MVKKTNHDFDQSESVQDDDYIQRFIYETNSEIEVPVTEMDTFNQMFKMFVSCAHTEDTINQTLDMAEFAIKKIKNDNFFENRLKSSCTESAFLYIVKTYNTYMLSMY